MSLPALATHQDGLLTRAQVLAAGCSAGQWRWRLASGRWQLLLRGVALTHTGRPTARQFAWAAVLAAGPGALLTGDAALREAGLTFLRGDRLDLVVPHTRRVDRLVFADGPTIAVRRARGLAELPRSYRDLPMVATHAAVLHAAAYATSDRAAELRLSAAVQQRLTTPAQVRSALAHLPALARRGLIAVVLDDVELGAHASSELEFLRFVRRFGLPRPDALQVRVREGGRTSYLDVRYLRARVSIEIDGAHHRDVTQWEADALRSLRVVVALPGERLIRLTPGMLRHDGPEVAVLLRQILDPGWGTSLSP